MIKSRFRILFFGLLTTVSSAFGQRSEVGFGIGTFNYTGDLVRSYNFKYSKPAGTVFYRSNLSKVVSFRAAITAGKVGASEKPIDAFANQRDASFDVFLFEGSTCMEYHFLDWLDSKKFVRFTPYLFAGIGVFGISGNNNKSSDYSNIQAVIPFGFVFKYIYNQKCFFALYFGPLKTWFDYFDKLS